MAAMAVPMAPESSAAKSTGTPAVRHVLLLHGLWMLPLAMRRFASQLRSAGWTTAILGYRSIVGSTEAAVGSVRELLRDGPPTHIVAHSLGGLMALEAVRAEPSLPVARVVCLGTRHCGSGGSKHFSRQALSTLYLGRIAALLRSGCTTLPAGVEVGMIAGNRPRGLGALVGRFEGAHDGTVAMDETRVPGLADHVIVDASHSGLLFSAEAARQAGGFLRGGRFPG